MLDFNLPLEEAVTLPAAVYSSDAGDNCLLHNWQYICDMSKFQKDGDFFATTMPANGLINPVAFITKGDLIKGYHNVCRHHASTILTGCGNCTKLRCPYHAWTYDLDGELIGTPEATNRKEKLPQILTETYGQFLFARVFGTKESAKKEFDGIWELLQATVPQEYVFAGRQTYKLNCNWKVFVDNFLDGGYHVNYIHPELAKTIDYKNYTTKIFPKAVLQTAPPKEASDIRGKGTAYYWWLFPNTMINVYGDMMDVNVVKPLTNDTCEVIIDFYKYHSVEEGLLFKSMAATHAIQIEDMEICARVQEGMKSVTFREGRYGKREEGMYHFHKLIAEYLPSEYKA